MSIGSKWARFVILGLLWFACCLAPIVVVPSSTDFTPFWFTSVSPKTMACVFLLLFSLSFGEALAYFSLVAFFKKFSTSRFPLGCRMLSLCLCLSPGIIAFTLLTISCSLYFKSRVFLQPNHLSGFFNDFLSVLNWTPWIDMQIGFIGLALGVFLSTVGFFYVPTLINLNDLTIRLISALILIVSPLFIFHKMAQSSDFKGNASYIFNTVSPTLGIFYGGWISNPMPSGDFSECEIEKSEQPKTRRPRNVVLVLIEALRADIMLRSDTHGVMPTLEKLAENGYSYKQAYAGSSESNYSNIVTLTGQHALKRTWRDTFTDLDRNYRPFYDDLQKDKYTVGYFASHSEDWQNTKRVVKTDSVDLFYDGEIKGKDAPIVNLARYGISEVDRLVNPPLAIYDSQMTEKFRTWVRNGVPKDKKFFARFYFSSSHFPYPPPPQEFRVYQDDNLYSIDQGQLSFLGYSEQYIPTMWKRYLNGLHYVDFLISQIIEAIDQENLLGDTTIIITGDHGQQFGEHKLLNHANSLFETAIRVPLIISNSPDWSSISLTDPVSHLDIAPTILDLTGTTKSSRLQGKSLLLDQAMANTHLAKRLIYSSVQSVVEQDAIIEWPYKFIKDERDGRSWFYNLEADPLELEPGNIEQLSSKNCLEEKLERFRTRQISYFAQSQTFRNNCVLPIPASDYCH